MKLTFFILVFYIYAQNSRAIPPPQSETTWRRSRYIIDNRRNALFIKKPKYFSPPQEDSSTKAATFDLPYQKDLTAEASISEPNFYGKYEENSIPRKIIKSYKRGGDPNEYNYNKVYDAQKNSTFNNFIQNEDEILIEVGSKVDTTTEKILKWVPKIAEDVSTDATSRRTDASANIRSPITSSYSWEITNSKSEEGNQIDETNEKHVYETRIETVSYHQEVIFNSPKKENWYQENMEPEPKNYEQVEENYEHQEQNYEEPEQNYEEPEKNYEEPERNYEVNDMSNERSNSQKSEDNQNKFGYVVEGTNYRKYRVEERTPDGFIVGEYGVVSHDDGSLRGVRYTAEEGTNPKLIYETLIKFLSL